MIRKDISGQTFGNWKVLFYVDKKNKKDRNSYYQCECKCGQIGIVGLSDLKSGKSTKCTKCRIKNAIEKNKNKSHFKDNCNADSHRIYRIWKNMKQRCYGSYNIKSYRNIGVFMCEEWKNDFMSFYNWAITNGYDDLKEIDKDMICDSKRISPKIYSPDTCIWIEKKINTRYSQIKDLVIKEEIRNSILKEMNKI